MFGAEPDAEVGTHERIGTIRIAPLQPADRERWLELWSQYQHFYRVELSPEVTEATWQRSATPVRGLCARNERTTSVGIVHFLFPRNLVDHAGLYLEICMSIRRAGTALGPPADRGGSPKRPNNGREQPPLLTHQSNATARRLY